MIALFRRRRPARQVPVVPAVERPWTEHLVLEALAEETARPGGSPLAAARALFTREDT